MTTTTLELNPEVIAPAFSPYSVSADEMSLDTERLRNASLSKEEYRKEAMKQIKAALASLD